MLDPASWQPLACVARAHGIGGSLRLAWSVALSELDAWPTVVFLRHRQHGDKQFRVLRMRPMAKQMALVDLQGLQQRELADVWRNAEVWVPTEILPLAEDDEIYLFDLLGKIVTRPDGSRLGTVIGTYDHGAGSILGVRSEADASVELLLPLSNAVIETVDDEANSMVIDIADEFISQ